MFDETKNFFFDLDKTIWNWDSTIIGAADLVDSLRESDRNVYFHTDNTLLTRKAYARKLTEMGIPADEEDVITSGYVAARHLEKEDVREVYAIGESGLFEELAARDINNSEDAARVVMGFDRQFSYNKLRRAMNIMSSGTAYVCSTETTFRNSDRYQPHQGPLNAALEEFGETVLLGKPGQAFRDVFKEYFDFFPERSVFIGDRLADIETGNRLGMETAAVMSGDIDRQKLAEADDIQEPDYGISSLAKLRRRIL
ncbi:MAG: HAD-IIA family hydrolase [Candidatus Nanohaloarchaea archaeon]